MESTEKKETAVAATAKKPSTAVDFFKRDDVRNKFQEILGKRGNAFTSSVLTLINQSDNLKKCEPESVYMCAMMAATLDLPLNSNLGFAYIIPYGTKAQFQMGYKGFKQLAMRSGQVKKMSAAPIYKDQLVSQDPLKGYTFDFSVLPEKDEKPVGYAAYVELINGFEKTLYMSVSEITAHGKMYSQTFKKGFGLWVDKFESMALKTVMKLLLNGGEVPLSTEMQTAVVADQGIINDVETLDITHSDNTEKIPVTLEDLQYIFDVKKAALTPDETTDVKRIIKDKETDSYEKAYRLLESK